MTLRIIAYAFQMTELPEAPFRRWPAFFQHGAHFIARFVDFFDGCSDGMFRKHAERCRAKGAGLGFNGNPCDRFAVFREIKLDPDF